MKARALMLGAALALCCFITSIASASINVNVWNVMVGPAPAGTSDIELTFAGTGGGIGDVMVINPATAVVTMPPPGNMVGASWAVGDLAANGVFDVKFILGVGLTPVFNSGNWTFPAAAPLPIIPGVDNTGYGPSFVSVTPEPASLSFLAIGAGGLLVRRRRCTV